MLKDIQIKDLLDKGKLWDYIVDELDKKHVGDISAKEIVLLSSIGRLVKNKKPYSFNLIIHSSSSAGKDHLVESVLRMFPREDIEAFGRTSETFLTYHHSKKKDPLWSWDGKILYLEEISGKILNNEVMKVFTAGLTKSGITKDQKAEVIEVNGKPVVICTSATTKPSPEILNRFSIVRLDESEEQTRRTFMAEEQEYDSEIVTFLRKLKPQFVIIPLDIQNKLANVFPAVKTRMRRAFPRFLDIVKAIAIFNHGNTENEGEILATWEDYDLAVRVFSNYRSGVSSIPLRNEDKEIVELLEKSSEPLSVKEILAGTNCLSQSNIYRHIENLKQNEILECFDLRTDPFNQPVKKYMLSEDMKDKNPISLPLSMDIREVDVPDILNSFCKPMDHKNVKSVKKGNNVNNVRKKEDFTESSDVEKSRYVKTLNPPEKF